MDWNRLIDGSEKVARIAAVIVAGAWVYFNAFRGRTFVPRLQLELSGRLFCERGKKYLLVTVQVKNVGSSIVKIKQKGTCLKMNPLRSEVESFSIQGLKREATELFPVAKLFPVLKRYLVLANKTVKSPIPDIEPGTAHNEQHLFLLPASQTDNFEIELRVKTIRWWIPAKWIASGWTDKSSWIPDRWIGRK